MSDSGKEMLDAIMRALEMEKDTFDFYTKAERKTFNQGGKRIFHWLARTEEQHYLKLSELYNALNKGSRWVFYAGSGIELEPDGPDDKHVESDTGDLEALEIAMEIEKRGIAYFEELAGKTDDPDGRTMLTTLRDEEKNHLRIIEERYRMIKESER